jgi:hypothetical protein
MSDSATKNQEMGRGGDGEDDGPLNGAARAAVAMGGLGECLDPMVIGPYGGSRAENRRRKRGGRLRTGSVTGASTVEKDRRARVRIHP